MSKPKCYIELIPKGKNDKSYCLGLVIGNKDYRFLEEPEKCKKCEYNNRNMTFAK